MEEFTSVLYFLSLILILQSMQSNAFERLVGNAAVLPIVSSGLRQLLIIVMRKC